MTTTESKGRFFYKTNRFESIRITNRIESIRIANWNALLLMVLSVCLSVCQDVEAVVLGRGAASVPPVAAAVARRRPVRRHRRALRVRQARVPAARRRRAGRARAARLLRPLRRSRRRSRDVLGRAPAAAARRPPTWHFDTLDSCSGNISRPSTSSRLTV